MIFVLLVLEIALTMAAYILTGKNFSSPSVLSNLSFLFSTVLLCAYVPKWNLKISFLTVMVIFWGNVLLLAGEMLSQAIDSTKQDKSKARTPAHTVGKADMVLAIPKKLTLLVLLFELVAILLVYHYIATNTTITYDYSGEAKTLLGSYRGQQDELHATWVTMLLTIGKIMMYFYTFFVLYALFFVRKKIPCLEIVTLVAAVGLCSLSSARIDIILLAGSAVVWIYGILKYKYHNIDFVAAKMVKSLFLILILMFLLFFAMGTLTGKTASTIDALLDTIVVYAGGGTIGLDKYLQTYSGARFFESSETMYGISSILTKFGCEPICKYRNLEFFFMGNSSTVTGNTYTVYRRLLHDYGYFGTFALRLVEGFAFGVLTHKIYQEKRANEYFRKLLICGTVTGILVTEAVDTHFLMTLPTLSEFLMLLALAIMYNVVVNVKVRFEKPLKILIKRKNYNL